MHLRKISNPPPLLFFFVLSLIALYFGTIFFPAIRLTIFSPFFAIVFQRKNFLASLWIAALCGLLIDFLSSGVHFGVFSFCSLVTAGLTYRFKHHFFENTLISIPLYTALISIVFSLLQFLQALQFMSFTLLSALTSFLIMPLIDALYAFLWFTCPRLIYHALMKRRITS